VYLVKKGGSNSNQTHLGLLECSKRRRCLLVEATQLAWASWAATTSLFSPINRGRRIEQMSLALLVLRNLSKLVRKFFAVKNIQVEVLPWRFWDVSISDFVEILHHSSSFFIRSSSFFGLQPVSSRNRIFQFILCTLSGPYLFCVLLFSLRLFSVPPFNELLTVYLSRFLPNKW